MNFVSREMCVIYSPQFKRIMIERNQERGAKDPLRSILENSLGDILPRLLAFYVNLPAEEQCSARLVLFGPGIESQHTKRLVHKIVNARSSTFDAVEFIKGLPGGKPSPMNRRLSHIIGAAPHLCFSSEGIGSGVRINYKHMYNFDLMCLYSNSETIRDTVIQERGYSARLDPGLNKIVTRDIGGKLVLQPGIGKLIPTIHALVYAIDISNKSDTEEDDLGIMRQELGVLLDSQEKFATPTPVLVLACHALSRPQHWTLPQVGVVYCLYLPHLA